MFSEKILKKLEEQGIKFLQECPDGTFKFICLKGHIFYKRRRQLYNKRLCNECDRINKSNTITEKQLQKIIKNIHKSDATYLLRFNDNMHKLRCNKCGNTYTRMSPTLKNPHKCSTTKKERLEQLIKKFPVELVRENETTVKLRCKKGHEFSIQYTALRLHHYMKKFSDQVEKFCPICSRDITRKKSKEKAKRRREQEKKTKKQKQNLARINKLIKRASKFGRQNDFKIDVYNKKRKVAEPYRVTCSNNHKFYITESFLTRRYFSCQFCADQQSNDRLKALNEFGYSCLSVNITDLRRKLLLRCPNGHYLIKKLDEFKKDGYVCEYCEDPQKINTLNQICRKHNLTLLFSTITVVTFECAHGHRFDCKINQLSDINGCPECEKF